MPRRSRQLAWVLAAVPLLAIAACGSSRAPVTVAPPPATSASPGSAQAPPSALFARDSVWNAPLSQQAPVDPSSPRLVRALVREVAAEQQARDGPWIETTSYSTPIYRVGADQPTVSVKLDNAQPWGQTLRRALGAVPIPADARPAAGSDGHLMILQPSTDRLWELWRAHREQDGWHAAWGGAIEHLSRSPGYYTPESWPGARSYWGSTATSLPVVAGTMTIEELRRGRVDHALAIDVPSARADAYAWPAQRSDGLNPDPLSLPEGAHLRIDPKLDVGSLYLPPMAQAMALAAQRYGMIVRDQTHHSIGFYAEDPTPTGANPYPALMGQEYPNDLLAGFPWEHVQVLRMQLRHGTGRPQ